MSTEVELGAAKLFIDNLMTASYIDNKQIFETDPFDDIIRFCEQNKAKFLDPYYQPDNSSLNNHTAEVQAADPCSSYLLGGKIIKEWRRYYGSKENGSVYDESNFGEDVTQGQLGDCYLCSVLSDIGCHRPQLIRNIFSGRCDVNEYGVYTLRLCDLRSKKWVYILVDDYFPINNNDDVAFLTSKNGNEMWCGLIEKACAKLAGSYKRICATNPDTLGNIFSGNGHQEVLQLLTGSVGLQRFTDIHGDVKLMKQEKIENVWEEIVLITTHKWPACTVCRALFENEKKTQTTADGLVYHHSYAFVGAVQMPCGT